MLFQAFIPRTWCYLLEEMVSRSLVSNIFSIWPPETSSGELEPYFPLLSRELVNDLLATKAAVWPVYELQSKYGNLESLVVASPAERESILQALARVGVSLTRPPRYIFDLLCDLSKERILNPEVAHILLRVRSSYIHIERFFQRHCRSGKYRRDHSGLRRGPQVVVGVFALHQKYFEYLWALFDSHCEWRESCDIRCERGSGLHHAHAFGI